MSVMSKKLDLKLKPDTFQDFIEKIGDLASIDDVVKIKITGDDLLMYSIISNEATLLALKSYLVKTNDYIEGFKEEATFDFIITSANKFYKNLKFFDTQKPIKWTIVYKDQPDSDDTMHIRSSQFANGKLKITQIGGEQYKIRDITKEALKLRLDPKKIKWKFHVSSEDFVNIKKLSTINSEEKILNISVQSNKVVFSEMSKWEMEVDEIQSKDTNLIFNKKYLGNIDVSSDFVNFNIFENFVLVNDSSTNLILSFEQDFSTDD